MGEGLEAAKGTGELVGTAADALGAAGDEELDVLAGIASSVARKASRLTLGSVRESGKLWPSSMWPLPLPGSTSTTMSLRFVFGRSSRVAFRWISCRYLADVHADDGVAVFEVNRGDLADLDPGDVDRLTLARRDRLGGGELSGHVDELFADEGTQDGSEAFCSVKIQSVITTPTATRTAIAIVSLLRPRD